MNATPPMEDQLRAQYEAYPYPARHAADEAARLITGSPSHLAEINHYIYAGRWDFTAPFRALIAGGGTGDAAIMLAQQLAHVGSPGEVVHLDLSRAAGEITRARAAARGLTNLKFVTGSLTGLDDLGLGAFDYVDCCGVLHHLEDPGSGLRALAGGLAEDGGMGLMLYGTVGRTGVYEAQDMLRMIAGSDGTDDDAERLATARALVAALPETNWLRRNEQVGDHLGGDDAGLFDLLLHSTDRAFTVPEIGALVESAGLRLVEFLPPAQYRPETYLSDPALAAGLGRLSGLERAAFAELLTGNMKTHVFYVVKASNRAETVAAPDSPAAVPLPVDLDTAALARAVAAGGEVRINLDGIRTVFPMASGAADILAQLDGVRCLGDMAEKLGDSYPGWDDFLAAFRPLYATLNGLNLLFLRYPPA